MVLPLLRRGVSAPDPEGAARKSGLGAYRISMLVFGLGVLGVASVLSDVVTALIVSYNILVAGLLVPILGGMFWPRATRAGAYAAMGAGTLAVLAGMFFIWDREANEPIYFGLGLGLVVFVVVSLATRATDSALRTEWNRRLARSDRTDLSMASATSTPSPDPILEDGGTP